MQTTLAFDVYGTLIDTSGVFAALENLVGEKAFTFTHLWRTKQLEYSFRRGLMQNYQDFSVCTSNALDYTCQALQTPLSTEDRTSLLNAYRRLPSFPDVREGLEKLKSAGYRLFAFSNGRADDVAGLLQHARIDQQFIGVVSTDEIQSFKPNPAVYAHFLRRAESCGAEAWLVSSNPFDVIGAVSAGMRGAWIKRVDNAVFDPWEIKPTVTASNLVELYKALQEERG